MVLTMVLVFRVSVFPSFGFTECLETVISVAIGWFLFTKFRLVTDTPYRATESSVFVPERVQQGITFGPEFIQTCPDSEFTISKASSDVGYAGLPAYRLSDQIN